MAKLVTATAPKTASTRNSRTDGSGIRRRNARANLMEINVSESRAFHCSLRPTAPAAILLSRFCLARAIQAETASSESPFVQTIRIALAGFCQGYDSGGNDQFHGLIGVPEAVNVFYCSVVSVRHHLNVRLFKYRIADKWNYRGHRFPPSWLPPFGAIRLKDSPHSDACLFKIDHIEGPAFVRLGCPLAAEKRTILL
jgi:hypothetical protein